MALLGHYYGKQRSAPHLGQFLNPDLWTVLHNQSATEGCCLVNQQQNFSQKIIKRNYILKIATSQKDSLFNSGAKVTKIRIEIQ